MLGEHLEGDVLAHEFHIDARPRARSVTASSMRSSEWLRLKRERVAGELAACRAGRWRSGTSSAVDVEVAGEDHAQQAAAGDEALAVALEMEAVGADPLARGKRLAGFGRRVVEQRAPEMHFAGAQPRMLGRGLEGWKRERS